MLTIQLNTPRPTATANRFRIDFPSAAGHGGCDIDIFPSGLKLIVMRTQSARPLRIEHRAGEAMVGFGFCLAGEFVSLAASSSSPFEVKTGDSGFFALPRATDFAEQITPRPMLRIYLMLEGNLLSNFARGEEDLFAPVFRSLDQNQASRTAHRITPLMGAILQQILNCPYAGHAGRLYLESKAMELLAHKMALLHPAGSSLQGPLKSADRERVRQAAEVLAANLDNPPDATLLARSVGMSRSKLHRCFHRVYGVPPFEYLRNHRLQTAMLLLQSGGVNVTEAALSVGYANLSHFAKAFKAMFGAAPGELLQRSNGVEQSQ
jgi:AraC family transcriptional activator of pyochelin receptor